MYKYLRNPYISSIILVTLVLIGSVFVGFFVNTNSTSLKYDAYFYNFIANGYQSQFLDLLVWPIHNNFLHFSKTPLPSFYLVWFGLFFIHLFAFQRKDFIRVLIRLFIAGCLISTVLLVDNHFVYRQRPFLTLPSRLEDSFKEVLIHWNSYPSGHVRDTVIYSMIMIYTTPQLKVPLILFTLFVAWSRIYVGAHYPTDVLAGLIVGFGIGKITLILGNEVELMLYKIIKHVKK